MSHQDDFEEYFDNVIDDVPRASSRGSFISKGSTLLALVVAAYFFLGNTLAANISLNSAVSTEFGQGVSLTTACSGSNAITATPKSTFVNSQGAGAFYLGSVVLTGIPTNCYGVKFILNVYPNSSNTPLDLFGNAQTDAVFVDDNGTFKALTGANGMTVTTNSTTSVTLTFDTPVALGSNVMKLALQSMPYVALTTTMCDDYLATTANTTISVSGGTCIVTFTSATNTFTAPAGVKSVTVLVVAGGGGGGGGAFAGGGGAGGLIYNSAFFTTPGQQYAITVGNGGAGGYAGLGNVSSYTDNSGVNGANSVFGSLTSIGGGGGGGYTTTANAYHSIDTNTSSVAYMVATTKSNAGIDSSMGKSGGSGGGSSENTYHRGGNTSGQGNIGGTALLVPNAVSAPLTKIAAGGGGGGAGGAGGDSTADHYAGSGGIGLQYSITGSATYYAGGGGGGTETAYSANVGAGGNGGGGAGGGSGAGAAGTSNTGGGGGGAGFSGSAQAGGAGGSGVVIIRFNP